MLFETIKNDRLEAMKIMDTSVKNILSVLMSELTRDEFNPSNIPSDDKVISKIKKFIQNIDDSLSLMKDANKMLPLLTEKTILEGYLPKQLSNEEIKNILTNELSNIKSIGQIMSYFKQNYSGKYDGKIVLDLSKQIFNI